MLASEPPAGGPRWGSPVVIFWGGLHGAQSWTGLLTSDVPIGSIPVESSWVSQ